jgi:hypothetical protein
MTILTQFLPAGDSFVGEIVAGPAAIWGGNPTFSGKEYLRTGLLKTYTSNYSGLLSALPTACVANGQALGTNTSWRMAGVGSYSIYGSYISGAGIYDLGGNKHIVYYASVGYTTGVGDGVKYGSSFSSAPTGALPLNGDGASLGASIQHSILYKNAIYASSFIPAVQPSYTLVYRSTGSAYSSSFTCSFSDSYYFAASANRLVAIPYNYMYAPGANGIGYTDNGTSWSNATCNIDLRYQARFCHSTVGNVFIIVRGNGTIATSSDGVTWTARTAPTGMLTSVAGTPESTMCINTASATYIMLGAPNTSSTYILKTTDGTNFTLVDLANSAPLVGLFTGTASMTPNLLYDGTRMILYYNDLQAYSTDEGATWTVDTVRYQNVYPAATRQTFPVLYNGAMLMTYWVPTQYSSYTSAEVISFAGRSFGAAPQFVGAAIAQAFATGSNLSTYFRLK